VEQQLPPPPFDPNDQLTAAIQLERNILSCILHDGTLIDEAMASLRREMFGHPYHRVLFRWFCEMRTEGAELEPTSIFAKYEKHMDKVGGVMYVAKLATEELANYKLFPQHIQTMIEGYTRNNALKLMEEFRPRFEDPSSGSLEVLLDEFERMSLEIRPKKTKQQAGVNNVIEWFERFVMKTQDLTLAFGLRTGWTDIDRMTLGFQRTDFIIVGARTSMGKSAFAIEVALRVSSFGYKVAIFSLEMTIDQIYNRMLANLAMVSMQAMRVGNVQQIQIDSISSHLNTVSKIHIDDERGATAEYILSEMRRMKRQEGLDLVIIDYLQDVKEPAEKNDNTGSALHRVAQKIRAGAKECDCVVIGLSQVKQEVDSRNNKRPFTSDLAGSAGLANVADGVIMLYRDEYYNPDTPDRGVIEVNVAKQRNGPTGLIKMKYEKSYQRITGKGDDPYGVQQESLALV
jgi:replicative DNA helicase